MEGEIQRVQNELKGELLSETQRKHQLFLSSVSASCEMILLRVKNHLIFCQHMKS